MVSWQHRFRAVIGNALTWAFVWGLVTSGVFTAAFSFSVNLAGPTAPRMALRSGLGAGMVAALLGFLAGILFSAVLLTERTNQSFRTLSYRRLGCWGAAAAAGLALVLVPGIGLTGFREISILLGSTALLGALSATGSLLLARWGLDP